MKDNRNPINSSTDQRCPTNDEIKQYIDQAIEAARKNIEQEVTEKAARKAADYAMDTLIPEGIYNMFMEHLALQIGKGVIRKGVWTLGFIVSAVFAVILAWFKGWLR